MAGSAFVDTNVLLYAFDDSEPLKQQRARDVITDPDLRLVVSTQVLNEFYVNATRKIEPPLTLEEARLATARFLDLPTVVTDAALIRSALELHAHHPISYWDALIVAAAATARCDRILTEDLADGDTIAGVRIENPFRGIG